MWQQYQLLLTPSCEILVKTVLSALAMHGKEDKDTIFLERSRTWRGASSLYETQQIKYWWGERCLNLTINTFWAERYCWKPFPCLFLCWLCLQRNTCVCSRFVARNFWGVAFLLGGVRTDRVLFKMSLEEEMPDELGWCEVLGSSWEVRFWKHVWGFVA